MTARDIPPALDYLDDDLARRLDLTPPDEGDDR